MRTKALDLVEIIGYLRQFSELDEGDNKAFRRQLPPVFSEEGGLREAAVSAMYCRWILGRVQFALDH